MHYYSDQLLSADYFGLFSEGLKTALASKDDKKHPPFVGMMSHGCSGDIWRRDYTLKTPRTEKDQKIDVYASELLKVALKAYESIEYRDDASVAMAEARLNLKYRVPSKQRLEWAKQIVDALGDRQPKTSTEVYAREQIILHERQSTEVVVQALRIGEIAIATTPTETYALTGLKLKLQSPLKKTMVIELANGGDGYIPPPEQHLLGGYNTWAARSAGLEVQAEPKIVEAALQLLEKVADQSRRAYKQSRGPAVEAVLKSNPIAYWRLDEFTGPVAVDSSDANRHAIYEPGVAFFLEGPKSDRFCNENEQNRATHFAGGRLRSQMDELGDEYSVSLWFWNGMPTGARDVAGWMFSRGRNLGLSPHGDHLGLGGKGQAGKLIFQHDNESTENKRLVGRTGVKRWSWNHVVLVRRGEGIRIYLNGNTQPEIEATLSAGFPSGFSQLFFGGRCDNQSNWEGRLDEISVFSRALSAGEIKSLSGE